MTDVGVGNICLGCHPNPTEEQMDLAVVCCAKHEPSREGDKDRAARKLFKKAVPTISADGEGESQTGRAWAEVIHRGS